MATEPQTNRTDTRGKHQLQLGIVLLVGALCGAAVFFLVRESRLKDQIAQQRSALESRSQALTNVESSVRIYQQQVDKLESLRRDYVAALATNQGQAAALRRDVEATRQQVERVENQSRIYKESIDQANGTIRRLNDQVRMQNDEIRKLANERNDAVQRYNRLATNFNDLARKWNAQQEELMRAATNHPSR